MSDLFEAPSLEYLGQHLPQYAFEEFIAQGGMGAVYRARQISLDRIVAIKVLPHELGENEEFRESFSKEAKAMAKVNHPNLIGVFDSGDVDGMPYIVMEYIEGSSLHDACWGKKLESSQAIQIVIGICEGLADAHAHGIIHRDIKPANILLTSRAEPKIGDFGLAHPSDSEETGLIMGTPGYTAPEIFEDANLAGVLADQYSVGMILHQLITGIDPAGTEGPPTVATGNIRLDAIWRKATQIHPQNRYPSVAVMAEELRKLAKSKSAPAPAAGRALQVGPPKIRPTAVVATKSSGSMVGKLLILGLLAAIAWFGYDYYSKNKDDIDRKLSGEEQPQTPGNPDDLIPPPPSTRPGGSNPPKSPANPGGLSKNPGTGTRPNPAIPSPHTPVPPRPPVAEPQLPPGDPELQQKAVALILDARKKRDAQLSRNSKEFTRLLDRKAATAAPSDAEVYEQIRKDCANGWVPEPDNIPELTTELTRAYNNAHNEQQKIDSRYQTELTRIRDFYVPMLQKKAAETSDPEQKKRLIAQAERAFVLSKWISIVAPEPGR